MQTYVHFTRLLRESLLNTGEVPASERRGPIGKAWREVRKYHLPLTPVVVDSFLKAVRPYYQRP